uniref:Uncharacterized protein n=1 Tax=Lepeophtheirus salmonis TaxID=72036 RepID=A0A0K2U3P7_LEPSM
MSDFCVIYIQDNEGLLLME